jgi:hypothetical protein
MTFDNHREYGISKVNDNKYAVIRIGLAVIGIYKLDIKSNASVWRKGSPINESFLDIVEVADYAPSASKVAHTFLAKMGHLDGPQEATVNGQRYGIIFREGKPVRIRVLIFPREPIVWECGMPVDDIVGKILNNVGYVAK